MRIGSPCSWRCSWEGWLNGLRARVFPFGSDPRVELVSIVFRLAGSHEYNQGRIESYNQAVDERFAKCRDHSVVDYAAHLRERRGIGYDAPMTLALCLTDAFEYDDRIPFSALSPRWREGEARELIVRLRRFAEESGFESFFAAHEQLHEQIEGEARGLLHGHLRLEWFDVFFGPRPNTSYEVIPSLLSERGVRSAAIN